MRPNHHQLPSGGSLNRINVTETRHNSNIYGTMGAGNNGGSNIINLSKSLENHGTSFNADRRYAETLQNLKKKEKQNRETIQTL